MVAERRAPSAERRAPARCAARRRCRARPRRLSARHLNAAPAPAQAHTPLELGAAVLQRLGWGGIHVPQLEAARGWPASWLLAAAGVWAAWRVQYLQCRCGAVVLSALALWRVGIDQPGEHTQASRTCTAPRTEDYCDGDQCPAQESQLAFPGHLASGRLQQRARVACTYLPALLLLLLLRLLEGLLPLRFLLSGRRHVLLHPRGQSGPRLH